MRGESGGSAGVRPAGGETTGPIGRLAALVVRRRRAVLIVWALAAVVGAAFVPRFQSTVESVSYRIPGSDADRVAQAFRDQGGYAEQVAVAVSPAGATTDPAALRRAAASVGRAVRSVDGIVRVLPPRLAPAAGLVAVLIGPGVHDRQELSDHLQEVVDAATPPGFAADVTGTSPLLADVIRVEERDLMKGEAIGLPLALIVLFLTLGALVAALMPILLGVTGLIVCLGVMGIASYLVAWGSFVESVVAMLGLGVGIDYALLVVRRYREERAAGGSDEAAVTRALQSAGRTVAFSGATVIICLPSLLLLREPLYRQMAVAAMLVVALMVLAALTLIPAALLQLGDTVDRVSLPARWRRTPREDGGWDAWARRVMRRPWAALGLAVALLLVAAAPATDVRLGVDYGARALQSEPAGRGLSTLQAAFPAAALAPLELSVEGPDAPARAAATRRVVALLRADDRVGAVRVMPGGARRTLLTAAPLVPVDSRAAARLVDDLRVAFGRGLPAGTRARLGGTAAESGDYTRRMRDATPAVVIMTLALSFLLLVWVFRSLVLPLKALAANALSVAAAYGLLVLVFQRGAGEGLLDFTSPGYLQAYMPVTLFVFVFGLSMDYEVFLVSRMREEWLRTGDNTAAVAHGLQKTGGVVTSAAAIMVIVFASFMATASVPEIKQFAFGLGAAVLIDATLVRMLLVPAFMRLAGRWNWWLPGWLDRLLPGTPSH